MAYRDNVTKLANALGISNDPSLREDDIVVWWLKFKSHDNTTINITGTEMNRGGRLFFQSLVEEQVGKNIIDIDETILARAREYFAELWEENPVIGKRPLIDALRASKLVKVYRR